MTSRRLAAAVGIALSLALIAAACSTNASQSSTTSTTTATSTTVADAPAVDLPAAIPDDQVFVTYTVASGDFSVRVPKGWARTESEGATTFTGKHNSVRIETVAAPDAPTADSAQADEVPAIETAAQNYEAGTVTEVNRGAGKAVQITYRVDGEPDPVTGRSIHLDVERYEFWRGGTEVILTLSGPEGADNVDAWRKITDSFAFL